MSTTNGYDEVSGNGVCAKYNVGVYLCLDICNNYEKGKCKNIKHSCPWRSADGKPIINLMVRCGGYKSLEVKVEQEVPVAAIAE
jgi:hypothetical protein